MRRGGGGGVVTWIRDNLYFCKKHGSGNTDEMGETVPLGTRRNYRNLFWLYVPNSFRPILHQLLYYHCFLCLFSFGNERMYQHVSSFFLSWNLYQLEYMRASIEDVAMKRMERTIDMLRHAVLFICKHRPLSWNGSWIESASGFCPPSVRDTPIAGKVNTWLQSRAAYTAKLLWAHQSRFTSRILRSDMH